MAHSVDFGFDSSETDSDYENLGEDEPGGACFSESFRDPGAKAWRCPESLQMEVFRESRDILSSTSEEDSDSDQSVSLQRRRRSAATLKVLSSMPSRVRGGRPRSQLGPRQLISHDPPLPVGSNVVRAEVEEISTEGEWKMQSQHRFQPPRTM